MNNLLVFFAIPVATIILSAILETFINCPLKVGGIFFSIFLVVASALGGTIELLFAAIVYTIISFLTAFITFVILRRNRCKYCFYCSNNNLNNETNSATLVQEYSENCDCNQDNDLQNSNNASNNLIAQNINKNTSFYSKNYR